jgi:hypothetical protein
VRVRLTRGHVRAKRRVRSGTKMASSSSVQASVAGTRVP